ncbi:nuclear receptor subfamily 0 group B member 1-like [Brienomyrus brachyistius]|uniref:nuclear receptor subfamily 0 group B member 1-like n=1 Tax=Brienomyrus brachyistius TaxID=42636 RepID=UPI0020B1C999|nr:nuclear receptor subfamily 0 group B member 1-like [Brienomyrus brachyistius]
MACFDDRRSLGDKRQKNSILYSILKNDGQEERQAPGRSGAAVPLQACSCVSETKVRLRCPQIACNAASTVLVKTLKFVKNVPCFRELPAEDQLLLVRGGWAQLLVLGMAQDRVDFETAESPEYSMLQRILTGGQDPHDTRQSRNCQGVPLADIRIIKSFLSRCWGLDISTKEYAYLKGAVLFNPDLVGLQYLHYIHGLQREAHQALNEYVKMIHREDSARFAKLFIALSMLRSINSNVVAELFFKPIIGSVNMEQLLHDMLYGK